MIFEEDNKLSKETIDNFNELLKYLLPLIELFIKRLLLKNDNSLNF